MPTDLLEKPAVEEAPREVKTRPPIVGSEQRAVQKPSSPRQGRVEAWARKVFEGHEDFLGWTPD